jgi:hypothetical protein
MYLNLIIGIRLSTDLLVEYIHILLPEPTLLQIETSNYCSTLNFSNKNPFFLSLCLVLLFCHRKKDENASLSLFVGAIAITDFGKAT